MKKEYQKPAVQVVKIQQTLLLDASAQNIQSNANLKYGKGGSVSGRSRGFTDWDDDE